MSNRKKVRDFGPGAQRHRHPSTQRYPGLLQQAWVLWFLFLSLFFVPAAHAADPDNVSFTLEG
ncbi:hypothetical protein, partial [Escherichia coli]|uniref:hypothetical protein n=1 Tax=Escherichia coli TaxID=562 RepID=UPI000CBE2051